MPIKPPRSKPQMKQLEVEKIISANHVNRKLSPCVLVGIRGYYLDSLGRPGVNDRGMFDDAFFWSTPTAFASFNGNTDPSRARPGYGTGSHKGMAVLKSGVWQYRKGLHKGYEAFRQFANVIVIRDGVSSNYEDRGMFGINIHKAGYSGTSSLGCQTVPIEQWDSFKGLGYGELDRYGQQMFYYILIEEIKRRQGILIAG